MTRLVRNFYPGPGALPASVLRRVQAEMLDYRGLGLSVMELGHRSEAAIELIATTVARLKAMLRLDDTYRVLLMQGGASLQFAMVPMNLAEPGAAVDYVDTGYWTAKAIAEARIAGRDVSVMASGAPDYRRLPALAAARPEARYLHLCSNNTVEGTQWPSLPDIGTPLVVDMSSDIMSRTLDTRSVACLYAHAQKTLGIAGVTVVALRQDLLDAIPDGLPAILDYRTHVKHGSNYNTPPLFAIYVLDLMLDWLEDEIGGVAAMEALNRRKAALLYEFLDNSSLFRCPIEPPARSAMNVVFGLPTPEMERRFVEDAAAEGLVGLAGHRSVGGCRASLYNPVPVEAVEDLTAFMRDFERAHG